MEDRAMVDLDKEIEELEQALSTPQEEEPTEPVKTKEIKVEEPTPQVIAPDLQKDLDTSIKRYNNYKASTDITIRNQRQELAEMKETVANLLTQVANLKTQKVEERKVASYFSDEDKEILGESTIDSIDKSLKDVVNSKVAPLEQQLAMERQQNRERIKRERAALEEAKRQEFSNKLYTVVPDFQKIIADSKFRVDYMNEVDPYSGRTRRDLFNRAETEGDVMRVASFFTDYKAQFVAKNKALEEHVVPTGVTGNISATEAKPEFQISEKFIDKFYDDLARGSNEYKGKKGRAKAEKIEAAIDKWVSNQFA